MALLHIPKLPGYSFFFKSKMIVLGILCIRSGNLVQMTWENDTLRNNASNIMTCCSNQQFSGLEEMKGNCGKTMCTGMMDTNFTV
jgi:hypothetical protein